MARMREPRDRWPDTSTPDGVAGEISLVDWPPFSAMPDVSGCLTLRHHTKPWLLTIWEPLATKAPSPARAQPHCCYIDTVIFYHRPQLVGRPRPWRDRHGKLHPSTVGSFIEYDRATMHLLRVMMVRFEGQAFELSGGHVLWRRRGWWAVYTGHRGTRPAREANGMPLDGPSWHGEAAHG